MSATNVHLRRQFCLSAALIPVACAGQRTASANGTRCPGNSGALASIQADQSESGAQTGTGQVSQAEPSPSATPDGDWHGPGLVIHGGAGTIGRDMPDDVQKGYRAALDAIVRLGLARIEQGQDCLDVVEAVVVALENHPLFNAGHGAVYTAQGRHELDAAIMRGSDLACGAITGISTVKNPIRLARAVMEKTQHVLLSGSGAESFADIAGVERVANDYFDTEHRRQEWDRTQKQAMTSHDLQTNKMGTVGCAVMDRKGKLAAGTSTGGMTNKMFGRVGDVPIIGAGTYANDTCCAISCTGHGEKFIRNVVAHEVSALMRHAGLSLQAAADRVMSEVLSPGDGGLIAIDSAGRTVFSYNSEGMYRARAHLGGPVQVAIWEQ